MTKVLDKEVSTPIYWQLAETLKDRIKSGEFLPGTLMPSENMLAREFGVSRGTARATLKLLEDGGIIFCDSTRGRIINEKNARAESSSMARTSPFTIGIFPYRTYHDEYLYYGAILNGLSAGAFNKPVKIKYILKSAFEAENCSLSSYIHKEKIDAIIWVSGRSYEIEEVEKVENAGFPVLLFNADIPDSGLNYISCDHYSGTVRLMDSLIHMGHKKIAFIAPNLQNNIYAERRFQAYEAAHKRYNLKLRPDWILEISSLLEPHEFRSELRKKVKALFEKEDCPSAIFAASGGLVQNIIQDLNEFGLKVPKDVSVVCFDKMMLPPDMPEVTCVEQPTEKMAEIAVGVLLKKWNNKNAEPIEITMEPEFIPGNSCAFNGDIS
jgi:GntR family transcriptional regulator, arabinose operon transcriptional repressor